MNAVRCLLLWHRWIPGLTELTPWGFITPERCARCGKKRMRKGL